METPLWLVYVPRTVLNQEASYVLGRIGEDSSSVYILASTPDVCHAKDPPAGMKMLGTLCPCPQKKPKPLTVSPVSVALCFEDQHMIQCSVYVQGTRQPCTCIVYDPQELLQSILLREQSADSARPCGNIATVVKVLNQTRQDFSTYEKSGNIQTYFGDINQKTSIKEKLVLFLLLAISWLYKPFMMFTRSKQDDESRSYFAAPTVWSQVSKRAGHLSSVASIREQAPETRIKSANRCVSQVIDSCLGICLMYYLTKGSNSQYIADICLSYCDDVATEMKTLLHWLMGAPAGLKLNSQLAHFLAYFFQYHIYLWTGYLYLLKPVLGQLVLYSSVTGVLGLTVQLALFQDIFTTLTLHIYCFYVYATRLYRLQVYALSSLWRLFCGKKWNVLRERVDSARYDAGQLFLGTLLFTILLFLLPTTGLFYVVFTLLRLVILTLQGLVGKMRQVINEFPSWTLILWLIHSSSLTDAAVFQILTQAYGKDSDLVISLQIRHLTLGEAVSLTSHKSVTGTTLTWKTFTSNLLQGHLIYPWIDRK